MGNPQAIFPILCLLALAFLHACTGLYPPTIYDDSTRRLSDYENNYFIKIPPQFHPLDSGKQAPLLAQNLQGNPSLFHKEEEVVVGVFRWPEDVEPLAWFEILDAVKSKKGLKEKDFLLKNLLRLFGLEHSHKMELTAYENFLIIEPHVDSQKTKNQLKIAVQPYATWKGGRKNSLFIAFVLYAPLANEKQVQKDFEILLENTELSYFLNYERSLDKRLTFN